MDKLEERLRVYVAAIVCPDGDLRVGPAMCANAMDEAADEITRLKGEVERLHDLTGASVTVGGGLAVYGTIEAISRVQDYILLDSTHPVEHEDVRRSLVRALQATESSLAAIVEGLEQLRANWGQFSYEEGGQAIDALIARARSSGKAGSDA